MLSGENQPGKLNGMLVIDEVSLMHALYLAHVSNRLCELPGCNRLPGTPPDINDLARRASPFGGYDVILAGDWNQIPAIGENIPQVIEDLLHEPCKLHQPSGAMLVQAAQLFMGFQRFQLVEQVRAVGDVQHTARIERMVDYAFKNQQAIAEESVISRQSCT